MLPPVVSLPWWTSNRDAVVLADVRWYLDGRSGRDAYDAGHLPGAVFVDLDRWLAGPAGSAEGRHPLPEPEQFALGMARLGIGDDDPVLAYDDAGGATAARLVWLLRSIGRNAALLDGRMSAYEGTLERGSAARAAATFTPRPWPAELLAGIHDVADPGRGAVVLDARDPRRFRGEHEPVDPRPGHVPGARNLPCRGNLNERGRFLPAEQLRNRFADVGVTASSAVVSYCGSGVTACHNLLVLELAGFAPGRLYPGSWSQYSADPARPAALGE